MKGDNPSVKDAHLRAVNLCPMSSSVNNPSFRIAVFTKPWKLELPELGRRIQGLGVDGIELPVRPGYPVHPENVSVELPKAARFLREGFGLVIESVAGPTDEATFAACAEAGISLVRICPALERGESYVEGETRWRRLYDALIPLLEKHGVTLGIQNHSGRYVPVHAMGLARLLADYDPRHIAAVWDPAHNALEGESAELALDLICGPHLRMVNLKNGFRRNTSGPEAEQAAWKTYWTSGRQGLASWPRVAAELKRRGWTGVLCLSAEYSDEASVDRLIHEDIAYARSLFGTSEEGKAAQ